MQQKSLKIENKEGQKLAADLRLPADGVVSAWAIFAHCFTCNKNFNANAELLWWFNRVEDPSYFLGAFGSKKSPAHYTFWTDHRLQKIIKKLHQESSSAKRKILHQEAEHLLNQERPLIPLFYVPTLSFLQTNVYNVYSSSSEHFDFHHSYKI